MSLSQPEAPPATNATAAPVPAVRSEDSILARIVASITVPGEELGVAPPARPVVTPGRVETVTDRALATAATKAVEETADRTEAAKTIAAASKTKPAEETAKTTARGRNSKVALVDEDKRAAEADEEAGTKRKSAAEKRLAAAEKKPTKGKAAPKEKPDAARVWVQVAGGASEADLPKAWAAVQKKASALKGREAYTTPLRATNRVVTGPFKDEDEAQAFVNQLARQGVSAFQFTSAAGQKMTKLTTK